MQYVISPIIQACDAMSGARPGRTPNSPSNMGKATKSAAMSKTAFSGVTTTHCSGKRRSWPPASRRSGSLGEKLTMEWLDALRPHLLALPNLAKFAIIIAIIVGVPALARCLRVPELIALLVFGVLLGPHVLGVYGTNHPIVQFFADLGMLMLMFTAGLEIDINLFRRTQTRSIAFGVITTMVPLVLGTAYGLASGYSMIQSIVIGSLLASLVAAEHR
jgi:hypothetical protein